MLQSRQLMERVFGFHEFRAGQEEIVEAVFSGEDVLAVMPTGAGKSICYQLPALVLPGTCLVLSPLIALMKDQVDSLRVLDLPATSIHSLMSHAEQEEVLDRLAAGNYKLVYAAPERLRHGPFLSALKKQPISLVAVDEAHCISEWGHDFRPDYLRIQKALDLLGRPQVIALTATATERVREDIVQQLRLRSPRQFITGFDRKNLFFEVAQVDYSKEKLALLTNRLENLQGGALVYTGTRKGVEALVGHLRRAGIDASGYHAGMEEEDRNRIQEAFLEARANLIVATNAFGMGIDRSDIRAVIHHQLPGTVEAYYQECGRAGRDGNPAQCLLLFSAADRSLQEFFIEASYPSREVILGVYQILLETTEDPIWLTYGEIGSRVQPAAPEMAVSSCLRILEEAGAVHRLNRYENRAELYLKLSPASILQSIPRKPSGKAQLLKALGEHYNDEELQEGVQFLPEEMIAKAGLTKETFRRIMGDLEEKGEGAYIPPFRGRGLRLIQRLNPEELKIDFPRLALRKAYELEKKPDHGLRDVEPLPKGFPPGIFRRVPPGGKLRRVRCLSKLRKKSPWSGGERPAPGSEDSERRGPPAGAFRPGDGGKDADRVEGKKHGEVQTRPPIHVRASGALYPGAGGEMGPGTDHHGPDQTGAEGPGRKEISRSGPHSRGKRSHAQAGDSSPFASPGAEESRRKAAGRRV